jgi:hypothetical protein
VKKHLYLFTGVLAGFVPASAISQVLSSTSFQYDGTALAYLQRNEVYAGWNPVDPALALKPGMKVGFYGRAEGCAEGAKNGPVTSEPASAFDGAMALTGVLLDPSPGHRWTPLADTEQCDPSIRTRLGGSFVHVNEDPVHGGIGLFTHTGQDRNGKASFFRQFGPGGKNNSGANANIEGTFVSFRFDWQAGQAAHPWAGTSAPASKRTAEIRTVQGISAESVGSGDASQAHQVVQVKQGMIIAVLNPDCLRNFTSHIKACIFQYAFNTAIFRLGVSDWSGEDWFKSAGIFLDPAQGNIAVIHGPIGRSGETTRDGASGLALFTSLGEPTAHEVAADRSYDLQITFDQFENALRIVAATRLSKSAMAVTAPDMDTVFGGKWADPDQWVLASVSLGQEVYNPSPDSPVYIGGAIRKISIAAAAAN